MNPAEQYILDRPEPYRGVLLYLQSIIETTVSQAELKYKYKIPFYYVLGRPFCYLNQTKDYVDIAFWNGAHLSVHLNQMSTAGRKMIKSLRYRTLEEINASVLKEVLEDAYSVRDKKFWK